MSAEHIVINPPKLLYIHLHCIQPDLYFGIIISVVNPLVELKCARREYIQYIHTYVACILWGNK
jgi:hypothetical protein